MFRDHYVVLKRQEPLAQWHRAELHSTVNRSVSDIFRQFKTIFYPHRLHLSEMLVDGSSLTTPVTT